MTISTRAAVAALMAAAGHAATADLIEHWTFDADFSGGGLNATPGAAVGDGVSITNVIGEFIRGTGALKIDHGDGTDADYLDIATAVFPSGTPATFSVAVWYRLDPSLGVTDGRRFVFETAPNFSVGAGVGTADDMEWFFQGGPSDTAGPAVNDGQWHHLVLVFDRANTGFAAYFHDGQFDGFADVSGTPFNQAGQADGLHIGNHRAADGSRNWQGYIDDFAIFDVALSPDQVLALYDGEAGGVTIDPTNVLTEVGGSFSDIPELPGDGPAEPALIEYWSFDTGFDGAGDNATPATPVGDGVSITSASGEFIRGTGAVRIDHGDGADADYVDIAEPVFPNFRTQVFTVAAWYRFDPALGLDDDRNFIFETTPNFSVGAGVGSADDMEWFFAGGPQDTTGPDVNDGQWHHIAIVLDQASDLAAYYHDGELRDLVPVPPTFSFDLLGQAGGLHIGNHRAGDGSRNFQGYVDDFAIWTEALGPAQVRALFDGQFEGTPVTPLNLLDTVSGSLTDVLNQRPTIVEPGWTLAREIPFAGPSGLDYDDATGVLYAGRRFFGDDSSSLTGRDGLYRIDPDSTVTQIAGGSNIADVEVTPDGAAVLFSEDFGGGVYRTEVGSTGRTLWLAGFAPGDDDPTGIAFIPQGWTGNAFLQPGDGLIQDRGNGNLEEIYVFDPAVGDLDVGINPDGTINFDEIYFLDADPADGDLITPFDPFLNNPFANPGAIATTTEVVYIADEGSPNDTGAVFRVTGPDTADRVAINGSIRPVGIAVDPVESGSSDSLVVYDLASLDSRVLRVNADTGDVTVMFDDLLGGGTATASVFGTNILWSALTMSADGSRLFFGDEYRRVIYEFVRGGGCRVDLTGDGIADIFDILAYFDAFGIGSAAADFDGNGTLDIFDIIEFFNEFSVGC